MFSPFLVSAAGVVPDCGKVVNGVMNKTCGFGDLIELINKIINFLLFDLATPLAALVIIYAGWLYLTSGGSQEKISKAHSILINVGVGYLWALGAWLVVDVIVRSLGFTGTTFLTK